MYQQRHERNSSGRSAKDRVSEGGRKWEAEVEEADVRHTGGVGTQWWKAFSYPHSPPQLRARSPVDLMLTLTCI